LPELIRRFSSNAVDGRVKQEIRDALPTKIRDRLRDEQEDERRRLLFQFSSNLAGHPGGRPILSYEDAVNLLAQSPTDAGREALRALLDAADRHSQISTTRPAAAGPSMTM